LVKNFAQLTKRALSELKNTYWSIFDADVLLRLEAEVSKLKEVWREAQVGELEDLLEPERQKLLRLLHVFRVN
jgi:hypothetical protein